MGGAFPGPWLAELSLTPGSTIIEGTAEDIHVGTLENTTTGSTITLVDDAGGRFKITDGAVVAGATPTDFGTATSHDITVRETLEGYGYSPRDSIISIPVLEAEDTITLATLGIGTSTIATGSAEDTLVGTLTGVTPGSTITLTDTAGSRFKVVGDQIFAGSVATDYDIDTSHNITVRETLAGATNTPHDTVLPITVTDDASAIEIAWVTGISDPTPGFDVNWLSSNPQVGWTLRYYADDGGGFALWHSRVLTADDITGPINMTGATPLDDDDYVMYAVLYNGTSELAPSNQESVTIDVAGDVTAPTISLLSPLDAELQASISANSVMTFNESVEFGANISIRLTRTGVGLVEELTEADIGTKLVIEGNELTINWSSNMLNSTSYDIQWDVGLVEDAAGNQLAASSGATDWNFTTIAATDCDATYIGQTIDTVDRSTYTFNSVNVGTAAANRRIVVGIVSRVTLGTDTLNSVTCNGNAMALVAESTRSGNPATVVSLYEIVEPSGTTANFVVTFSATTSHCSLDVFTVANSNGVKTDTLTSTAVNPTGTITVPTNGCAVGICGFGASAGTGSVAWTNLSEDSDIQVESGTFASTAHSNSLGGDTTITATITGTGAVRKGMAVGAWSP
jgi:hypothetical protein